MADGISGEIWAGNIELNKASAAGLLFNAAQRLKDRDDYPNFRAVKILEALGSILINEIAIEGYIEDLGSPGCEVTSLIQT